MRIAAAPFIAALAFPAVAGALDRSPERYDETVNPALQQVGSDLHVQQTSCATGAHCRFAARQVVIDVTGPADRPATERIVVTAMFPRDDDGAASGLIEDTLSVLGATMVAYDPGMAANRRGELLLELGEAALSVGEAHRDSADMHYSLAFDDVSGRLEITAATIRAGHR